MTHDGVLLAEFDLNPSSLPVQILVGPDKNLWFTEQNVHQIGRITTEGVLSAFPLPRSGQPAGMTVGADGNMWFAELAADRIARITTDGVIIELPPVPNPDSSPRGITAGPDGNIWFAEFTGSRIGRLELARSPKVRIKLFAASPKAGD
jgi:virginiamycin B lyase